MRSNSSPLHRRLRDLHAATQHAAIQQRHYAAAGKIADLYLGRMGSALESLRKSVEINPNWGLSQSS